MKYDLILKQAHGTVFRAPVGVASGTNYNLAGISLPNSR
jgi:hypothetical protein